MERDIQSQLGQIADILGKLSEDSDNAVISKDGQVSPPEVMSGCVISYVNCRTKQTEVVSLKKGDTFAYGDWDGSRCVRKTYTC